MLGYSLLLLLYTGLSRPWRVLDGNKYRHPLEPAALQGRKRSRHRFHDCLLALERMQPMEYVESLSLSLGHSLLWPLHTGPILLWHALDGNRHWHRHDLE